MLYVLRLAAALHGEREGIGEPVLEAGRGLALGRREDADAELEEAAPELVANLEDREIMCLCFIEHFNERMFGMRFN